MFCPKCHTELKDSEKFCRRCGEEIKKEKKFNQFSSAKTFTRMHTFKTTHEEQYNYSKNYSNIKQDKAKEHEEQYNYSKNYSDIKQDKAKEHEEQYNYSKNYSNIKQDKAKDHEEQYNDSKNYSNTKINTITSEEDYIKAYINQNYKEIINSKFSIPALLFGPFYLIYRKMWLKGIIILLAIIIINIYTNSNITTIIQLIINIYLMYKFKDIYINNANKKIEEIKILNPDKSSTEIYNYCKKAGGTLSLNLIIILIIIFSIIQMLTVAFKEYTDSTNTDIYKINTQQIENMKYQIPNELNYNEKNSNDWHYYNYSTENSNYCSFIINTNKYTNLYQTEEDYLNAKRSNSQSYGNINTISINNITWKTQVFQNDKNKKEIYYVTMNNNILYILVAENYDIDTTCNKIKDELLYSMTFN